MSPRFCVSSLAVLAGLMFVSPASQAATDKDTAASKALDDAMNDYLFSEFAKGTKKLEAALRKCGPSGCSGPVVAKLQLALGVMAWAAAPEDEGHAKTKEAFAAALKADPNATPDAETTPAPARELFDEVKGEGKESPQATGAAAAKGAEASKESKESKEDTKDTKDTKETAKDSEAEEESCPPGFPGCGKSKKDTAACEGDDDCDGGECVDGSCKASSSEDEGSESGGSSKRHLVGAFGALDLLLLGTGQNVCAGTNASYACFTSGTTQQFFPKAATVAGTNEVQGGLAYGSTRLLLSYDWDGLGDALGVPDWGLRGGARLGWAFGGSPEPDPTWKPLYASQSQATAFQPLHVEARLGWTFGKPSFAESALRPYVFVSGGLAQVNAAVPVTACATESSKGTDYGPNELATSGLCAGKGRARSLDAYQVTGMNFVGLGGGAIYGLTKDLGLAAELQLLLLFPTPGTVFQPSLGPVYAF